MQTKWNEAAERSVQHLNIHRRIIERKEVTELNTILQQFVLAHRTTPQSQKYIFPVELLFNRKLSTRLNFAKPTLSNIITSQLSTIILVDFNIF